MNFDEIIQSFVDCDTVPEEAIRAALAGPAAFVDRAIALLDGVAEGTAAGPERDAVCVLVHVLGEIGDERVFAPLVRVLALPDAVADDLFGDALTSSLVQVLISLMGDDPEALERVMLDAGIDQFVRDSCFRAWTHAALTGRIERGRAHDFLAGYLPRTKLKREDFGLSSWADAVAVLRFADLTEQARKYLPVRVPGKPIWEQPGTTFRDFEDLLARAERDPDGWKDDRFLRPFESTIAELSSWYGYSEDFRRKRAEQIQRKDLEEEYAGHGAFGRPAIASNPYRDVGRNDPCPCGSGRKFKKCCLGK